MQNKSYLIKLDWRRLEAIAKEIEAIITHHGLQDSLSTLTSLENLIDEVRNIEENE